MNKFKLNCFYIHMVIILSVVLNFSSGYCQSPSKGNYPLSIPRSTIITGKLPVFDGPMQVELQVSDPTDALNQEGDYRNQKIYTDTSGSFRFNINCRYPVYLIMNAKAVQKGKSITFKLDLLTPARIFVEPGDSIYLEFITESIRSSELIFSGVGAEKLKCMQEIVRNVNVFKNANSNASMTISRADSLIGLVEATLQSYNSTISTTATTMIRAGFLPWIALDFKTLYNDTSRSYAERKRNFFHLKKLIYANIDLKNSDLIYSQPYLDIYAIPSHAIAQDAFQRGIQPVAYQMKGVVNRNEYRLIADFLPDSPLKDRLLAIYITWKMRMASVTEEGVSVLQDYISKTNKSSIFKQQAIKFYHDFQKSYAVGTKGFAFALPDTSGSIVKMSDFKGKVVVLDFMYNTCPACKTLMPFMEKVEAAFSEKDDVVFISISIDKEIEGRYGWKAAIGKSSTPTSIQLYTEGLAHQHPIIKHYGIQSFPTLIVLDKQGNLALKITGQHEANPRKDNGRVLIASINRLMAN